MAVDQNSYTDKTRLDAYDDLLDTLACQGAQLDPAVWDDLADRLAAHDVTHLAGGSADAGRPSPYRGPADVDLERLIRDLSRAPEPRLRDALIALLLRHPEYATAVRAVLIPLKPHDPARHALTARLLAAAALQYRHRTDLERLLPTHRTIDIADIVTTLDLPIPEEGNGQPLLDAAQRLIANRLRTVDYVDGWEDVARHTLRELAGIGSYTRVVARGRPGRRARAGCGRPTPHRYAHRGVRRNPTSRRLWSSTED